MIELLKALFQWIDGHPAMYPVLVGISLFLLLGRLWQLARSAVGANRSEIGRVDWRTGLVTFLALLAWQWPYLLAPNQYNPDESQMIAGAITIGQSPDFWRSLDGTTSGPLNALILLPTHWLGVPQDFFNARLTGLLLLWAAWAASFGLIRRWMGSAVAFTALLPAVIFLGSTTEPDFLHYSSERLPVALSCIGIWLLAHAGDRNFRGWSWWLGGISLGLLPWAKLQAGPLAAMLSVWACGWVLFALKESWLNRIKRCVLLAVAVLLPTLFLVSVYVGSGQWSEFWASYFTNNVGYAQDRQLGVGIEQMVHLAKRTGTIPMWLGIHAGTLLIGGFAAGWQRLRPGRGFTLGAVAVGTAIAVVILPGRGYLHYLLFLVFPLSWWMGSALQSLGFQRDGRPNHRLALVGFALVTMVLQVGLRLQQPLPDMFGRFASSWQQPRREIAELVNELKEPNDTLAVWGWAPDLYVQTALPQATREAHTERQIKAGPQRDTYYRPRFISELNESQPAFIIDAIGPRSINYFVRENYGHETFPELKSYLEEHYTFIVDLHRERLYLRNDRLDRVRVSGAIDHLLSKWEYDPWSSEARATYAFNELRPARSIQGLEVGMMEPPVQLVWPLQGTELFMVLEFGHDPKSYAESDQGNGTVFSVTLRHPNGKEELLWERHLNPTEVADDRGLQKTTISLPPLKKDSELIIATGPGPYGDSAWDWAYLARMSFRHRPDLKFLD